MGKATWVHVLLRSHAGRGALLTPAPVTANGIHQEREYWDAHGCIEAVLSVLALYSPAAAPAAHAVPATTSLSVNAIICSQSLGAQGLPEQDSGLREAPTPLQ